jgi:hypothetical protein
MLAMKLTRPEHHGDDEQIARLIDWHTPEPEVPYRPRHCASRLGADLDQPPCSPAAAPTHPEARLVRAFTAAS